MERAADCTPESPKSRLGASSLPRQPGGTASRSTPAGPGSAERRRHARAATSSTARRGQPAGPASRCGAAWRRAGSGCYRTPRWPPPKATASGRRHSEPRRRVCECGLTPRRCGVSRQKVGTAARLSPGNRRALRTPAAWPQMPGSKPRNSKSGLDKPSLVSTEHSGVLLVSCGRSPQRFAPSRHKPKRSRPG